MEINGNKDSNKAAKEEIDMPEVATTDYLIRARNSD